MLLLSQLRTDSSRAVASWRACMAKQVSLYAF